MLMLPWPPSVLSPNSRTHWAPKSRAAKAYRNSCFWCTKASEILIDWDGIVHVWIKFYPPDRRHRDDDNVISAFKAGRDGVAEALGLDDKRFRIHPWLSDRPVKGGCVQLSFNKSVLDNYTHAE